jgi:riboflavin-specific deaminase-like protein
VRTDATLAMPTDPTSAMPADWVALWEQILQARSAPLAVGDVHALRRGGGATPGWRLAAPRSEESAAWFDVYAPLLDARLAQAHSPSAPVWVLGQLGLSLDGYVATASGDSYFVTGPASLAHLHRLRALCDAVLVGAGTVAIDDPRLTTRLVPGPQPVRVVLDPAARLDGCAQLLRDGAAPTLWLCDSSHAGSARERGAIGTAEVLPIEGLLDNGDPARDPRMARVLDALNARGLRLVLVEGGGVTVSRCLAAGLLDRLHLVIAPVLIGDGRRGVHFPGPQRMADCLRPAARRLPLGEDMLWDLDLRAATPPRG